MKLRAIASLALIVAGFSVAHAQGPVPGTVTGVVTDASSRAPLENASVALRSASDSTKVVANTITARDGKFQFTNVPLGTYVVECMILGHKSYRSTSFVLGESSPRKALGSIPLTSSVLVLREVEVQTQRETFNPSLDRRRYNVDHDVVAQSSTAADLLAKVPSVQVDFDGGVTLRGSRDVTILIDGRPSRLMGKNRANVLLSLPAAGISQIEVVTNPSARYVPDGSAGIINLVTRKDVTTGLTGDASGHVANVDRNNENVSLAWRRGPFEMNAGYRDRDDVRKRFSVDNRALVPPSTYYGTEQSDIRPNVHDGTMAMTWHAGPGDLLTLSGEVLNRTRSIRDVASVVQRDAGGAVLSDHERIETGPEFERHRSATLSFQHDIPGAVHQLQVDGAWSHAPRGESSAFREHWRSPNRPDALNLVDIGQIEELDVLTVALHDVSKGSTKVEGGYMLTYHEQDIRSDADSLDVQQQRFIIDPTQTFHFRLGQLVHAVYGTYERSLGKVDVLAGLRTEYAAIRPDLASLGTAFRNDYFGLFPTLSLRYSARKNGDWQLSYGRRIHRPVSDDLNPFPVFSNPFNVVVGNPHLRPESTHLLELGYMMRFAHSTFLPSAFYRDRTDGISTVTQAINDSTFLETPVNVAHDRSGGVESIITVSMGHAFEGNLTGSVYYEQIDASNLGLAGLRGVVSGSGSGNLNISPWRRTVFELNPLWKSPKLTPQGTQRSNFVLNAGARQSLIGDRLSVTVAVTDLLKTQRQDVNLDLAGIRQIVTNRRDGRVVYVGLGYHFGIAGKHKDKPIQDDNGDNN